MASAVFSPPLTTENPEPPFSAFSGASQTGAGEREFPYARISGSEVGLTWPDGAVSEIAL